MSQPNRPGFQKPSKFSSASNSSGASAGGGAGAGAGGRWSSTTGGYAPGSSPLRGMSPLRSNNTFPGIAREDMDNARSHTNPLYTGRGSDIGSRLHNATTPTKAAKENRERSEPWRTPGDKAQYGTKALCSGNTPGRTAVTPGRNASTPKTPASMRFATPPKPSMARRKILAENREAPTSVSSSRIQDDDARKAAGPGPVPSTRLTSKEAAVKAPGATAKEDEVRKVEESNHDSTPPEFEFQARPRSSVVCIEELQKRIQKFLEHDELPGEWKPAAADAAPDSNAATYSTGSTVQPNAVDGSNGLLRRLSGPTVGDEFPSGFGGDCADEAPYHPVFSPYSPRPDILRARKSPKLVDGNDSNVSPLGNEGDAEGQEKVTPTYDPKHNFLSPRPQFLRYKPLRHLEILRKSAEAVALGGRDLDLESPATDDAGDSSRVESTEKEDGDFQDEKAQEVQSKKTSSVVNSPQRWSREAFLSIQPEVEREKKAKQQLISEVQNKSPQLEAKDGQSENKSGTASEDELRDDNAFKKAAAASRVEMEVDDDNDDDARVKLSQAILAEDSEVDITEECLEDEAEEVEEEEEHERHSSWNGRKTLGGLFSFFFLVALLISASGSPGLLPRALQESQVANFWKTSPATEPVRNFLQTTSGLWREEPGRQNTPHFRAEVVHQSLVGCEKALRWGIKAGIQSSSICHRGIATLWRYTRWKFGEYQKALADYAEELNHSQMQEEVNDWSWVPEYDFVVPRDMFDPVQQERLAARLGAWNLWKVLSAPFSFMTPHKPVSRALRSANFSVCALPAREVEVFVPSTSAVAVTKHQEAGEIDSRSPLSVPRDFYVGESDIQKELGMDLAPEAVAVGLAQDLGNIVASTTVLSNEIPEHITDAIYLNDVEVCGGGPPSDVGDSGQLDNEAIVAEQQVDVQNIMPQANLAANEEREDPRLDRSVEEESDWGEVVSDDILGAVKILNREIEMQLVTASSGPIVEGGDPQHSTQGLQSDPLAGPSPHEGTDMENRSSSVLENLGIRGWKLYLVTTGAIFLSLVFIARAFSKVLQKRDGVVGTVKRRSRKAKTPKKIPVQQQQPIEKFSMLSPSREFGSDPGHLGSRSLYSSRSQGLLSEVEGQDFSYLNSPSEDILGRLPTPGMTKSPLTRPSTTGAFTALDEAPLYHTTTTSFRDVSFIAPQRSPIRRSPISLFGQPSALTPERRLFQSSTTGVNDFTTPLAQESSFSLQSSKVVTSAPLTPERPSLFSSPLLSRAEERQGESVLLQPRSKFPVHGSNSNTHTTSITPERRAWSQRTPSQSSPREVLGESAPQPAQVSAKSSISSAVQTKVRERDLPASSPHVQKSSFKGSAAAAVGEDAFSFPIPDGAILEDSSLGRFTAILPVVRNEGTVKEQVKLTPVKRSSRIRTRLQSSPCSNAAHLSHQSCSTCAGDGKVGRH